MPPKAKFTREQIVEKAFGIVREDGFEALTARNLGAKLGSSARPIFTVFQSMDEVAEEVLKSAKTLYTQYIDRGLAANPAFKGVGTQYILFAVNEPKLFQLLFMAEHKDADLSVMHVLDDNFDRICASVAEHGVNKSVAKKLYEHMWVYTHGIASLCATRTCKFSAEQISSMMTEVFSSLLGKFKE